MKIGISELFSKVMIWSYHVHEPQNRDGRLNAAIINHDIEARSLTIR
jgi:hypothetical protein